MVLEWPVNSASNFQIFQIERLLTQIFIKLTNNMTFFTNFTTL